LGLTIISQRAAKIDKNVLSQCNTQMILKVTNPNDLKAIVSSVEGLQAGMDQEIQRLPIGVALIMGGNIQMPLFVEVRPRQSRHGGESVELIPSKRL
jgi:DNA helicase HerA-like ATPase